MLQTTPRNADSRRPQIVIVGAGFAGLSAAKALASADADVTIVDKHNHHLFQPLLYQVATASLSPNQVANPIRSIVRKQRNAQVILDEVINVDRENQEVILRDRALRYDYLVLATGAQHAYFGRDEWAAHAPGLKSLEDANNIRERILLAFERAELTEDGAERDRLLTFVIVGGGPTGVELAGAIAELAQRALACDFRRTRCHDPKVLLVEAGPRLLPSFSERASHYAKRVLEKRGVTVRLGVPVSDCREAGVTIGDEEVSAATIIWAAGVKSSPAGLWVDAATDRAGRTQVEPDLSVEGIANTFVIGDAASIVDPEGKAVPGLAPAAKQQGKYVGELILRRLRKRDAPERPFRYVDFGSLATIGRSAAIVEFGKVRITGFPAWLFWSVAHIYFLIDFRSRILVALDWLWSYFTLERGARLIEGEAPVAERSRSAFALPRSEVFSSNATLKSG